MPSFIRLAALATIVDSAFAQSVTQVFNFTTAVDIENSAIRPNGHLLLSTFANGGLYTLNPHDANPQAEMVALCPGATALTGITAIGPDKFAVSGGVRGHYHYDNETIYTIDFGTNDTVKPVAVATLPQAEMLNGLSALPTLPHVVLSADSRVGGLWRVDTSRNGGDMRLAFQHETLAAPANASVPIGINGLKVAGGYVYFTNSARGILGRVPVNADGTVFGEVSVIALSEGVSWDDLFVDASGVAYVAQRENDIVRISPDGRKTVVVDSPVLLGPTSLTPASDRQTVYVTTAGATVDGVEQSGQVVEVRLPMV